MLRAARRDSHPARIATRPPTSIEVDGIGEAAEAAVLEAQAEAAAEVAAGAVGPAPQVVVESLMVSSTSAPSATKRSRRLELISLATDRPPTRNGGSR